MRLTGGKAVNGGAYGCVFMPPLRCKGEAMQHVEKKITKLMHAKFKEREYGEIVKYKRILERIPNFERYFLISGFSLCEPAPLTVEDKIKFDEKCSSLKRSKITASNVNDNLGSLIAMTMPYGGMELAKYMFDSEYDYAKLVQLNQSLMKLLQYGILPMNHLGLYHCDIKDNNVLVEISTRGIETRLIDWGSATLFKPGGHTPPITLQRRSTAFNAPFSLILFNDTFKARYSDFLRNHPSYKLYDLRTFIIEYTMTWVMERGAGQLKLLNSIFTRIFQMELDPLPDAQKDDIIEYEYTYAYIYEYIMQVLLAYTKEGEFLEMEYFTKVFVRNTDIWAFCLCYLPIIEMLTDKYEHLEEDEKNFIYEWRKLFMYIISCSTSLIDSSKVMAFANRFGKLFSLMTESQKSQKPRKYETYKMQEKRTMFKTNSKTQKRSIT